MEKRQHLEGLISAPFTPMHPDGSIHIEKIAAYSAFLSQNGVKGAFVCGSTGEGPSLTQEEKKAVISAWGAVSQPGFSKISMLGGTCAADAKELMRHSQQAGFDAVAIVAPYYFQLASVEALVDYCVEIASEVSEMPVYFYHIPVLTGANFSMLPFLKYAEKVIPNLAGIKFTHEDLMDFKSCIDFSGGKYDILWGRDECLLAAMAMGAKGAVGSTYNYAAPLYLKLIEAFKLGKMKEAGDLQRQSITFIQFLGKYGGIAVGKSFMKLVGMDCGEFRLPNVNPSADEVEALDQDLKGIGFYDYCNTITT